MLGRSTFSPATGALLLVAIALVATFDEIKKAYRTLAKELHPDRNPDPASVKRFVAVARAYEELENLPRE